MASTICCWATAFASINNLDLTAILGSLLDKTSDLADSCSQHEVQRDAKVAKLETNTMSDQGSINPIFNSALSEMRGNLFPSVLDNWHNLDGNTMQQSHKTRY
jgi:hypothetical protein